MFVGVVFSWSLVTREYQGINYVAYTCSENWSCNNFLYPDHKMWGVGGYNGFALYHVRSINPIPIEGFSSNLAEMFTSTRGCAEPMLPMCQLKVKVTIEGQISNNQILVIMSCPLCKSYTN